MQPAAIQLKMLTNPDRDEALTNRSYQKLLLNAAGVALAVLVLVRQMRLMIMTATGTPNTTNTTNKSTLGHVILLTSS